jgi:plasmid stabilization system protein ParE
MSLRIVFNAAAQEEYDAAALWYEGRQMGLGFAFAERIENVLGAIAHQPDRCPVIIGDVREAPVSRFPYCIYYRVRSNQVVVIAIFHTSRDPQVWESRI